MRLARFTALACCCAAGLLVSPDVARGQAPAMLGALRTPPSPAFTLLGIEPSAVERPATPTDAAVSLINRFRDGTIPQNFAFETSPYWLVGRPHLTWRADSERSVPQSVARTASLSVATAETGTTAAPVTSLALGFRTLLASGRLAPGTTRALEALEKVLSQDSEFVLSLLRQHGLNELEAEVRACPGAAPTEAELKACSDTYERKKRALTDAVLQSDAYRKSAPVRTAKDVVAKREGFFLELAAGAVWDFASAAWESQQFRQRAVWVTPSYEAGPWAVVGVLRYVDDAKAANENAVDWGGRAIYSTSTYALSFEYVERAPIEVTDALKRSHRLVGIAEYRMGSDTWLVASFGKDRQKSAATTGSLVAQLGLSFNFSKERYKF